MALLNFLWTLGKLFTIICSSNSYFKMSLKLMMWSSYLYFISEMVLTLASSFCFIIVLFLYCCLHFLKIWKRCLWLLVHFPNGHSVRARLQLRAWHFTQVSTWVVGMQIYGPSSSAFPGALAVIWIRSRTIHLGCRHHTQWINLMYYDTIPWCLLLKLYIYHFSLVILLEDFLWMIFVSLRP